MYRKINLNCTGYMWNNTSYPSMTPRYLRQCAYELHNYRDTQNSSNYKIQYSFNKHNQANTHTKERAIFLCDK